MYNLIPEDWGGFVTPWVEEIARSFVCLKAVHFRRMIVKDDDLELLARSRGHVLQVLKLDKCSGFSTDGLLHISRFCRYLIVQKFTLLHNNFNFNHIMRFHLLFFSPNLLNLIIIFSNTRCFYFVYVHHFHKPMS